MGISAEETDSYTEQEKMGLNVQERFRLEVGEKREPGMCKVKSTASGVPQTRGQDLAQVTLLL